MKKALVIALTGFSLLVGGTALANEDHDRAVRDLRKAEEHVRKAIDLLNHAHHADRLDKEGNGETALNLLRTARSNIEDALDNVKKEK
jgi:hypothetical protein